MILLAHLANSREGKGYSRLFREVGAVRRRAEIRNRRALTIPFLLDDWIQWQDRMGVFASRSNSKQPLNPFASPRVSLYNRAGLRAANPNLRLRVPNSVFQNLDWNRNWKLEARIRNLGIEFSDFGFRISGLPRISVSTDGSVTNLIAEMKAGNPHALDELYRAYFPRLVALARKKLASSVPRSEDEEDVVQSVFGRLCQIAERGWYPSLRDRDDLWVLLFCLTARKIGRLKRNQIPIQEAKTLAHGKPFDDESRGLELLLDHEPTPHEAAVFTDEIKQRMDALQDDVLCRVAQLKMENFTEVEIAEKLGCVTRTVERKLRLIRALWEEVES
jgi:DNA-directed RNA polymerase specialized sigma24 family protein